MSGTDLIQFPSRDEFAAHLNTEFLIRLENGDVARLELIEVSELVSRPPQRQFHLIFKLPAQTPFEQRIFTLEHEKLGTLDLFLVPVEKDENWIKAQAVFNTIG